MAYAQSVNSFCSVLTLIFGNDNNDPCIALREKRQNIRILFQRFVNSYAKYSVYTPEEIEADEEIFEAVLELDGERCQVCYALIDLAVSAKIVFDDDEVYDRSKLAEVARNLEKKKIALEKMPFILEATKNDEAMMLSCQLPLYDQICLQPKTGTKRQCNFRMASVTRVCRRFY